MFGITSAVIKRFFVQRNPSLYSADEVLSEKNKENTTLKFSKLKPIRLTKKNPSKKAAVLIPLCEVDGKVSLLYTLRAAHLKNHRGQISFPGGMQDNEDKTLSDTALRETNEELGIPPEDIDVWASGSFIFTRRNLIVLPVIGRLLNDINISEMKVNTSEVEEVFTVPLEDLCNPANLGYTQFKKGASLPAFTCGNRRIWGITALMTNRFLSCLLPPEAYTHEIKFMPPIKAES